MALIEISNQCSQCGLCSQVCPVNIIERTEDERPYIENDKASACLECGQCVAVCPAGALSHEALTSTDYDQDTGMATMTDLVKRRRSIRQFKKEAVSEEVLTGLFDGVTYAPTGGNQQPVKWTVVSDPAQIKALLQEIVTWMKVMIAEDSDLLNFSPMAYFVGEFEKGVNRLSYDAPHLVIAHAQTDYWHGGLDCTISMSYLEVLANAAGLGTCWAGAIDFALKHNPKLRDMLHIPENHMNHNVLLLGKAKYKYHRLPSRRKADVQWL